MIVIAGSFRLDDGVTDEVMAACKAVMQAITSSVTPSSSLNEPAITIISLPLP